ncbi:MAG: SGNH/GDSL hydrolase family protein [Pseudomonadota bacterium]
MRHRRTLVILAVLGMNAAIIGLALYFRQHVIPGWLKGPLIDPAAPYAPENATPLFAFSTCLTLDLYLLGLALWRRYARPRWWAAWLTLALSMGLSEGAVRAYLAVDMVTYFRPHPILHFVVRPNLEDFSNLTGGGLITTNEDGMREVTVPREPTKGEHRVLVLGDSSNFGHGVEGDEMWEAVLQDQLRERLGDENIHVLNGACPGWTTYQAVEYMKLTGLAYHPDMVIAGFNNDPGPEYLGERRRVLPPGPVRSVNGVLFHFETYLLAREVVLSLVRRYSPDRFAGYQAREAGVEPKYGKLSDREMEQLVPRVPMEEFLANLTALNELGQERGFAFVWVNMPINRSLPDLMARYVNPEYREAARELAEQEDFPHIDVDAAWQNKSHRELFQTGHVFHPNAQGHRLLALQVADELLASPRLRPILTDKPVPASP